MVVLPADHWISDEPGFRNALSAAARVAARRLARDPRNRRRQAPKRATATSSARTTSAGADGARRVERFVEKPDRERATELLGSASGAWWNAGHLRLAPRRASRVARAPRAGDQWQRFAAAWIRVSRWRRSTSRCRRVHRPSAHGTCVAEWRGQGRAGRCRLERRRLVERAPRGAGPAPVVASEAS